MSTFRFSLCLTAVLATSLLAAGAASLVRPDSVHVASGVRPDSIGVAYSASLWPKVAGVATIYYTIDPASDPNATPKIKTAIATFNKDFKGLIQWVASSSRTTNYVDINLSATDLSGECEANEGYEAKPAQPMGGSTSCTVATILHEMGHVIGLWHEQSRTDSSTYVDVSFANVIKSTWSFFTPQPDNAQPLGLYDYASLMEYPSYSMSRNGAPVIETIPAGMPLGSVDGLPAQTTADYSPGDKEGIERLYGAAPTEVTVTSNPAGLNVLVDGVTTKTPKAFAWALNSTHTLAVASGVQTLKGNIVASTTSAKFYYTYGRWSDSTLQSHTITVTPGNGTPQFPQTSPQVATYSANFIQLVPYTATVYPAGSGSVSVSPLPKAYSGASGKFFVARQAITLTATAAAGWTFYEFNNAPFWLPGGLGANPKTVYVPDTGNPVATTAEFSDKPVYTIDVSPNTPTSNLAITADGGFAYAPKNFSSSYDAKWTPGSTHTLSVSTLQYPYSVNSRYAFVNWNGPEAPSRAGPASLPIVLRSNAGHARAIAVTPHNVTRPATLLRMAASPTQTVTLPSGSASYVATLAPQFAPATNFSYPPCGGTGTLSPKSPTNDGFYPSGQKLTYSETPSKGWTFAGWSFDLTGHTNPSSLTATDETLVFANFNTTSTQLSLTGLTPASAPAGSAAFTLTISGTGFTRGSLVAFNGIYRTVTYVSSTKLTVPIGAADVKNAGSFQVFVENFPAGWNGCAVFGYQPFFVAT